MRTPRITLKLFRTLGLTVLLIIASYAILYQNLTRHYIASQFFLRGEALAYPLLQKVNFTLEVGGNTNSLYGLSNFCEGIHNDNKDLVEVAVLDQNGRILAHNDIRKVGKYEPVKPLLTKEKLNRETATSLDTYIPIINAVGIQPIFVKISFSKQSLERQSYQTLVYSIVFSITAILVFLFVIYFSTNALLGKRITGLLDGYKTVAKGHLDVRLLERSGNYQVQKGPQNLDELDYLMESFDEMAFQLAKVDAKRRQQEKQLSFLATHDQLTGLANRRVLEHVLRRAVARARRNYISSFMLMDLDNFKFINDTLGHTIGDQVLITLTGILQKQLRSSDLLARFGGDEFALLLEGEKIDEAKVVAERICQAVEEHRFTVGEHSFHLGISIGIVTIDGKYDSGALLSQADTAMYAAKKQGRNRVVLYYPEDNTMIRLSQNSEWVNRIKDALDSDGFVLFYQPVIQLSDGKVHHYEALIRLKENGGVITPDSFIPAAEQFGLMPQIDRWVVKHVVYTLQEYPENLIYMNLSGYSLADEALLSYIEESLLQHGVEPERIGFEITETSVVHDLVLAESWIRRLKAFGCQFALDDFGAGFNSFYYLRSLPINQLKLDGSFISTLGTDPSLRPLVQAMHDLAKALQIETVAEFVENEEITQILKEIGVTHGQGYHLGRPAPNFLSRHMK